MRLICKKTGEEVFEYYTMEQHICNNQENDFEKRLIGLKYKTSITNQLYEIEIGDLLKTYDYAYNYLRHSPGNLGIPYHILKLINQINEFPFIIKL